MFLFIWFKGGRNSFGYFAHHYFYTKIDISLILANQLDICFVWKSYDMSIRDMFIAMIVGILCKIDSFGLYESVFVRKKG